jgi:hypothetical protein
MEGCCVSSVMVTMGGWRIAGQRDWRCWVNDPAPRGRRVASLGAAIGVPACTAQGS